MRIATLFLVFGAAVGGNVLPARATAQSAKGSESRAPLEGLAARPVQVLPVQYVVFSDTLGWGAQAPKAQVLLAAFDSLLTSALKERGLQSWRFADDATRAAKRNVGFVADPHVLAAMPLRAGRKLAKGQLAEPLASQLRSLIALNDARQVMLPVEIRVVNKDGKAQPLVRLAVIDARASQVVWLSEIVGPPAAAWSDTVLTDLATRVADLVVVQ